MKTNGFDMFSSGIQLKTIVFYKDSFGIPLKTIGLYKDFFGIPEEFGWMLYGVCKFSPMILTGILAGFRERIPENLYGNYVGVSIRMLDDFNRKIFL